MAQPPLWRRLYDTAERAVAPHVESAMRSEHFARGAALAGWAQATARAQVEGLSARVWHLVNLPAGTDIVRLRAQIGALDREVRRLALRLDQERSRNNAHTDGKDADGADARPP